ncbi:MAG TPA: TlyA family RNA methyltransferase, partial [Proteobacteria bacterium]|nr:TlyA family RNA methyltransferase [Pseudomonadota bacterium]
VGISTGGFADCLLQRGVRRVYGIDVGYGQVAWKLRRDDRVVLFERTNIRYFDTSNIPEPVDIATVDVSFISLVLVIPKVAEMVARGGYILTLVKPQFELSKGEVGKGGVVRDEALQTKAVRKIEEFARSCGLDVVGVRPSVLKGPKGNQEYFILLKKGQ